jgi:hypothetical protein
VAASSEQLFVSRLARLPVRAPTGETIGRIADVVIARRESGAPPPVLGFTVMVQRRPIFLGVGRVKAYKHPAPEINHILELLALAHAEGLDVSGEIEDLLGKIASNARAA